MRAVVAAKFLDIFSVLLVVSQLTLISTAIYVENKTHKNNEVRFYSVRLAEELRHSSRDLTTAARGYVATGDPHYWQEFSDILDVRNGLKPRADGRTVPLRVLMSEAGFNEDELRLLDLAETKSDELSKIEMSAMKLLKEAGSTPSNDLKRKSINMIYDFNYRRNVQDIMAPILTFEDKVNQRTLLEVEKSDFLLRTLLIVIAVLLVITAFVFFISTVFKNSQNRHV